MNVKKIGDYAFYNSATYQKFLQNNPGKGNLKIRAYAASEALPVEGLKIIISSLIDGEKVIFFEGVTDKSGMINTLSLPAPKLEASNLEIPLTLTYQIEVLLDDNTIKEVYKVNMYDGVCVVQNINFVPGGGYGN